MWELDYKETWVPKNWCFWTVIRKPLWTTRRSNQSILKEINPEYSLEGLMVKLNLKYFGHLMQRADSVEKTLMLGKICWRRDRPPTPVFLGFCGGSVGKESSFRMDWFDFLAVQGTLKSLLQHHSSKASSLQCSALFTVPTLTSIHDYWKNHSLD